MPVKIKSLNFFSSYNPGLKKMNELITKNGYGSIKRVENKDFFASVKKELKIKTPIFKNNGNTGFQFFKNSKKAPKFSQMRQNSIFTTSNNRQPY